MLVDRRFPANAPMPGDEAQARPVRTVIGDIVKRFLRATKPPARYGAGMGATALQRLLRAVLWADTYVAAGAGIATLYAARKAGTGLRWAGVAIPFALLATFMVLAKGLVNLVLVPIRHLALTVVAAGVAIEALLGGRLFIQLAYEDNVKGLAGTVLNVTDGIVAPFRSLEGTTILHDTGVVEFATLTAMEAVLVATIASVLVLMFWSEFLHMYRRIRDFFAERSERRQGLREDAALAMDAAPVADMSTASADLSATA